MTEAIDHERCSQLLGAYVARELGEQDRLAVEGHLTVCSECDRERVALTALVAGAPDLLSEEERKLLHERVEAALGSSAGDVIGVETAGPRRVRRGQLVGIAASVVLLVGGLLYVGTQGQGGGDEAAVTEVGVPSADPGAPARDRARPTSKGRALGVTSEQADSDAAAGTVSPGPVFDADAGALTERDLARLGRRGDPFVSFAETYTVSDALQRRDAFLDDLVALAPDSATGADIRACSERVFSGAVDAILPAYGALARFDREDALILGYAWSDRSEGALDRWMYWAWSPGDCSGVNALYQTGRIRR